MVDYYCKDEKDDSRFMTAWFYVNSNVKIKDFNANLKRKIIDNYFTAKNTTEHNKTNIKNMVNAEKE